MGTRIRPGLTKAVAEDGFVAAIEQTGWTNAVPSEYLAEAGEQGKVEALTYYTKNYAWDSSDIRKTTYVYLPYGYDEKDTETRYNILYLMHGWGGHGSILNTEQRTFWTI